MNRFHLFGLFIILMFVLTACGSSYQASSGSSSGSTSSTASTPAANPTKAPAANPAASALRTASATVNGKTVTLLTNAQGMTFYYLTTDTATTSTCTGGCASAWPPYLANALPAKGTLSGALMLQTNANGSQVTYNGHPLYTYSGDTAAGQTNGEGIGNKWFVATSNLPTNTGGSTSGGTAGY